MKQCTKCLYIKNKSEFPKHSEYSDGLSYWCHECWKIYRKNRYYEDLEKSRQYTNDKRAARIRWLQELKSNIPCADCGKIYKPYCMDYDHVFGRGEKNGNVSRMVLNNVSKDIILEEIKKCDLVCLLCHNRRTKNRFDNKLGKIRKYKSCKQRNINIINEFKNKSCAACNKQYEPYFLNSQKAPNL